MNSDPTPISADIRCVLQVGAGRLALSGWPGLRIAPSGDAWIDPEGAMTTLAAFGEIGAEHVVALCETSDLPAKAIPLLRLWTRQKGLRLLHAPLRDYQPPNDRFLRQWRVMGPALNRRLRAGAAVALTCSYGAGRSGTIAALMLHEQGSPMQDAMRQVRAGFRSAIESCVQEKWLQERERKEGR